MTRAHELAELVRHDCNPQIRSACMRCQALAELERLAADAEELRAAIPIVTDGRFDGDSAIWHYRDWREEASA